MVVSDYYDHVDELSQRDEEIFGVPTGLTDLDKLLGGLQKSDLLIIAGRPGSGKTGFLLSVAKNAAQKHKKNVAIFSLEMSNEQLGAAFDRPGNRDRYPAPAHRKIKGRRMADLYPGH